MNISAKYNKHSIKLTHCATDQMYDTEAVNNNINIDLLVMQAVNNLQKRHTSSIIRYVTKTNYRVG